MKIAQYHYRFRLQEGGVARAVIDLCGTLAGQGEEVLLLTADSTDLPSNWNNSDGTPRVISISNGPFTKYGFVLSKQIISILRQVDILHLHGVWDPVCVKLGRIAEQMNLPYMVSIHGMLDDLTIGQKSFKKRAFLNLGGGRSFLEKAGLVHSCSEVEAEQSHKWFPKGNSCVLPLLVDLSPYQNTIGPEIARQVFDEYIRETKTILFLSRLHPIKRIEVLIDAAAILKNQDFHFNLLIAGSGEASYETELRRRVSELQLDSCTHFLGFVSGIQKQSLIELSDVFVLPSQHENWGVALIEALACGTPVVTTQGVNIWRELQESGGASIVNPNPENMAAELFRLLESNSQSADTRNSLRNWALNRFDQEIVISQFTRAYSSLVNPELPNPKSDHKKTIN